MGIEFVLIITWTLLRFGNLFQRVIESSVFIFACVYFFWKWFYWRFWGTSDRSRNFLLTNKIIARYSFLNVGTQRSANFRSSGKKGIENFVWNYSKCFFLIVELFGIYWIEGVIHDFISSLLQTRVSMPRDEMTHWREQASLKVPLTNVDGCKRMKKV